MEMLGGKDVSSQCRKPEIMADAAYSILCKDSASFTGNFVIDDDLLRKEGITNFDSYAVEPGKKYANPMHIVQFLSGIYIILIDFKDI